MFLRCYAAYDRVGKPYNTNINIQIIQVSVKGKKLESTKFDQNLTDWEKKQ